METAFPTTLYQNSYRQFHAIIGTCLELAPSVYKPHLQKNPALAFGFGSWIKHVLYTLLKWIERCVQDPVGYHYMMRWSWKESNEKNQDETNDKHSKILVTTAAAASAVTCVSTFKASQSYANHVFLKEFQTLLDQVHHQLVESQVWMQERQQARLEVSHEIRTDIELLMKWVDLLKRLDQHCHYRSAAMAYAAGSMSSGMILCTLLGSRFYHSHPQLQFLCRLQPKLLSLGVLGLILSLLYRLYLLGIHNSHYYKTATRSIAMHIHNLSQTLEQRQALFLKSQSTRTG